MLVTSSFLPGEVNKCLLIYVSDVCFLCKDDSAVSACLMEETTCKRLSFLSRNYFKAPVKRLYD